MFKRSLLAGSVLALSWPCSASAGALDDVSVAPAFFNPSIGQAAEIRFTVGAPGSVAVSIVDRDGFPIRAWPPRDVDAGPFAISWNGRDDEEDVVPDEAYFLRLVFQGASEREIYDPLDNPPHDAPPSTEVTYSRTTGTIAYALERPSRVHIQAGQARVNPITNEAEGPVLKTVVDRQPRVAGRVIEQWNGMDESGQVYIPALPDFGLAILATPLPENPLITVGNRQKTFTAFALTHRSPAATAVRQLSSGAHAHHAGLTALEDRNPQLRLEPGNAEEVGRGKWRVEAGNGLRFQVFIDEKAAGYFLAQPTQIFVFLEAVQVARVPEPGNPQVVELPLQGVAPGEHQVAVNWGSSFGPVGVAVVTLEVREPPGTAGKGGGQ